MYPLRTTRLDPIDGLRAVAVLAVIAQHASLVYGSIGARGVDLFFVISGFCLAYPPLRAADAGGSTRFDRHRFWLGRLLRIVPAYEVALVLFFALSFTAFGTPAIRGTADRYEFAENVFFLLSYGPSYNPSFWTLGVEARWYLVFPMVLALYGRSKALFGVLALAAYAVYFFVAPLIDAGVLPCFMLGIVAADVHLRGASRSALWILVAAISLAAAIVLHPFGDDGGPLWHLAAFAVVLAGIGPLRTLLSLRPLVWTGVASYSIYLVHQPFLVWAISHGVPAAGACALALGIGFAFFAAVERPSLAWRTELLGSPRGRAPARIPESG